MTDFPRIPEDWERAKEAPKKPTAVLELTEMLQSKPDLRLVAFDPQTGDYHAVEVVGQWVGTVTQETDQEGTVVKLALRPSPVAYSPDEEGRVLRSWEPLPAIDSGSP